MRYYARYAIDLCGKNHDIQVLLLLLFCAGSLFIESSKEGILLVVLDIFVRLICHEIR